MNAIPIHANTHVLVVTGAGVSAESGIPTFRGVNGLWNNHPVERVASPDGFRDDPALVWQFYSERRAGAKSVAPNRGHHAIAALEARLGDRFLLATQNVDGLHARARSQRILELHGSLFRSKCSGCARAPFADDEAYATGTVPACGHCERAGRFGLLRPDIVWFGESLDPSHLDRVAQFIARAGRDLVFVAAGTSGAVYPAAGIVDAARRVGGDTWLVNAERAANTDSFAHFVEGQTGTALPRLFDVDV